MTLSIRVDTADPTPPYEQLRRQLAELIETAQLHQDDRLPPVRQLARDLGLAVGTVARSYAELETAGLVTTRRGAGTRVAALGTASGADLLQHAAAAYVARARALGVGLEDARVAITAAWS